MAFHKFLGNRLRCCLAAHWMLLVGWLRVFYWRFRQQQGWFCFFDAEWLFGTCQAVLLVRRWRWASHVFSGWFSWFQKVHRRSGFLEFWWSVAHGRLGSGWNWSLENGFFPFSTLKVTHPARKVRVFLVTNLQNWPILSIGNCHSPAFIHLLAKIIQVKGHFELNQPTTLFTWHKVIWIIFRDLNQVILNISLVWQMFFQLKVLRQAHWFSDLLIDLLKVVAETTCHWNWSWFVIWCSFLLFLF